ncbi:unnamed protein product [Protopolystoma xenopodis]|uniref:Uncharacterized protein n=1 Tax=Protopolystoma xenopodis TaxID=117903 RepID=A0A3S4ZZ55_9PLAT|nr:unnamed protein product [Protopolystoma xenopodis]
MASELAQRCLHSGSTKSEPDMPNLARLNHASSAQASIGRRSQARQGGPALWPRIDWLTQIEVDLTVRQEKKRLA